MKCCDCEFESFCGDKVSIGAFEKCTKREFLMYQKYSTDLLAYAKTVEAEQDTLQKELAKYKERAEKAEMERDEYFKHLRGLCFCCAHRTDGFDCKAKCYGHKRGSAWVYAGPVKEE